MSRPRSRRRHAREWVFFALIWSALGLCVARLVAGAVPDYSSLAPAIRGGLILLSAAATAALAAVLTAATSGLRPARSIQRADLSRLDRTARR